MFVNTFSFPLRSAYLIIFFSLTVYFFRYRNILCRPLSNEWFNNPGFFFIRDILDDKSNNAVIGLFKEISYVCLIY